jgi:hypothetical protein
MDWDLASAFDMRDKSQFPQVPGGGSAIRDVLVDMSLTHDRMLTMIPRQMHLHTTSEHSWDGMLVRCIPCLIDRNEACFLPGSQGLLPDTLCTCSMVQGHRIGL